LLFIRGIPKVWRLKEDSPRISSVNVCVYAWTELIGEQVTPNTLEYDKRSSRISYFYVFGYLFSSL